MNALLRNRVIAGLLLVTLMILPSTGLAAQGNSPAGSLQIPITGTFTDATGGIGQFVGSFNLQRFAQQNGSIAAIGTLTGTLTDAAGNVLGSIVRTVVLPLLGTATQATCDILHLELGPLDLDLLGLTVHLNRVVLDIAAEAGAGNLLGNLLCAVAHLLDQGGPLAGIVQQLNNILNLL